MRSSLRETLLGESDVLSPSASRHEDGLGDAKSSAYNRSSAQLRIIDRTRQLYVDWMTRTSQAISKVLRPLLRELPLEFSKDDVRFKRLRELRTEATAISNVHDKNIPELRMLLDHFMTTLDEATDAARQLSVMVEDNASSLGFKTNGKEDDTVSASSASSSLYRALRWTRPFRSDPKPTLRRFLEVIDGLKLSFEVLKSSMCLIESLESERAQLQQALKAQPKHLELVKEHEASRGAETGTTTFIIGTTLDPRFVGALQGLNHHCTSYKDRVDAHVMRHQNARRKRIAGTCDWLVKSHRFISWLDNDVPPQSMWCWGLAGTGKTFSTARVIDILARNKRKHAYYYLGTGQVQTSEGIILSLIAQLCQGQKVLPEEVEAVLLLRKSVRRTKKGNSMKGLAATMGIPLSASPTSSLLLEAPNTQASLEVASKSDTEANISTSDPLHTNMEPGFANHGEIEESDLLGRFLHALQSMCRELGDVSIILDGWDESRMDSKKDFQTMLTCLSEAGCRLYITSRSEPDISRSLSPLEIHIDPDHNDPDMVISVLQNLKAAQSLQPVRDVFPYERLARYITQISHGVFNLARIQVEILLSHHSILGPKTFGDIAFTLPTSRNLIVEQGLKTLERDSRDIAQIPKAVLLMLVNSVWPISKEGLREVMPFLAASSVRVFKAELLEDFDIFSHLEAFITVDPGNSLLGLALEDISEATKVVWPTPVDTMEALANMGLNYLLSNTFQSGCTRTESALVELLQDHPYLEHSCHCWAHYVRLSEELDRTRHTQVRRSGKLLSFFKKRKGASFADHTGFREREEADQILERQSSKSDKPAFYGIVKHEREEVDTSSQSSSAPARRIWIDDTDRSQPVLPFLNTVSKERDIERPGFYRAAASSDWLSDQPPIRMPKEENIHAEIVIQPVDTLEGRQINARHDLRLRSAELCKKANIRLVMQVLLYTNSKYLSLGISWGEFVSWIESMSPLQIAARFGLASVVDSLSITVPDDITKADDKGATPLHAAAIGGVAEVVDFLLEKGASTAIVDAFGKTPMHYAKESRNDGIFRTLFERFCKIERGKIDAVNDLISYYATLIVGKTEGNDERLRELALIRSVEDGKTAIVSCLVGSGVSPDCKNKYGVPVLHIAVHEGRKYPKTPELLLSLGANPSAVSELTKESTLHVAARTGSLDLIRLLVAASADPRAIDRQGQTVLFPALEAPDQKSPNGTSQPDEDSISRVITFLLRRGVDPSKKDKEGKQLLHKAAFKGMKKVCKVLLLWGVEDINPKDNAGKTPRDYAQEGGFEELGDLFQPVGSG